MRALILTVALLPAPALAHPHVFVTAGVEVVLDGQGAVTGVWLTWTYDEFFSFLLTSELGIDTDGDMILAPAEQQALADFVLTWPEDFAGDLTVAQGGQPLALSPRAEHTVSMDQGIVVERHYRPLAAPVSAVATPVTVQVYDPFYYVAYEVRGDIPLQGGEGCEMTFTRADLNAAYSLVDELLYGRPASDVGPDEQFPEVGYAFADTVTITCAP
jgi:ABC-type uncharacterized transport system substrate-binding protein